ncbi:MAG: universal stress protein [Ktedonobacterales bacterium]
MFRHILVPLDGSARAERALPAAVALATAAHSSITLLTATRDLRPSARNSQSPARKSVQLPHATSTDGANRGYYQIEEIA